MLLMIFLDFSKIESGGIEVEEISFSLETLIQDVNKVINGPCSGRKK